MRTVRTLGVAIVLVAIAAPAVAQTETDLCLTVQTASDVDLTDATAVQDGIGTGEILVTGVVPCEGTTGPVASASPIADAGTGAWIVGPVEVDPMTDDRRALAHLEAETGTTSVGGPITLDISCAEGSTGLSVGWGWRLGSERLIDVDTRIGEGEVTTEPWFNSTGWDTSYGGAESAFIQSLFGESRLALRLTTEAGPVSAAFDITGIEDAVANVREVCGW
jgi:hypothetical protein